MLVPRAAPDDPCPLQGRKTCEEALATLRGTTFQVFQRTVSAATTA